MKITFNSRSINEGNVVNRDKTVQNDVIKILNL